MRIGFQALHPAITVFYYVGALSLLFLLFHPLFIVTGVTLLLAMNFLYDGGKGVWKWKGMMLITTILLIVVNVITSQRGSVILWQGERYRITGESLLYGTMMAGMIVAVIMLFISYQQVVTADKFLYLFARLLPQWAMLTMLAVRFMPLLRERLSEIEKVQRVRLGEGTPGWKKRMQRKMKQLEVLLTWSLEEGLQSADSMRARGYGVGRRTAYVYWRWRMRDSWSLFILGALMLFCYWGRWQGWGVLDIYPDLERFSLIEAEWLLLMGYLLFISFPILIEAKETL
ncbi:energy-coupling factor transporter transmembrane component T [Mechercharimyces sp. CAU 1602]|uniref:energy-coupling factor transporter transmembrane component T n=1 Tax=Mechercharimyces sp. CAU 1602 TaxID=2973933 RepID=UPI002163F12C|nr:energy-coupling factor transporter transmembrane component T [Mechercharimyces sp. CAU 1602]MCS1350013.1 energy-coupling factor transporter transmembrane protein EcfT [Mechercharimyces sp. CAU 1602]